MTERPVKKIAVTGAAGQIAYSLLFRLASGGLYGADQPIELRLLDLPQAQAAVKGVVMELEDCAFPALTNVVITDDPDTAFKDIDVAFLVGSRPRSKGMERSDLLAANAEIFRVQGAAIDRSAKREAKILVVGNPANTNALILAQNAPSMPASAITAMLRLDHNRAKAMLAAKLDVPVAAIEKLAVWGNHSPTMFADVANATAAGKAIAADLDQSWYRETFIPKVAQRGTAIIEARGASSAASAANAALDHMYDWVHGSNGKWVSMGIASPGLYGIPEGLISGFPVICKDGAYEIVTGLELSDFAQERIAKTVAELSEERDAVAK